jgi:cellulose synthase/poly-beta-1,6-N-acetylglucosamine synthase-like glycosyltransferase
MVDAAPPFVRTENGETIYPPRRDLQNFQHSPRHVRTGVMPRRRLGNGDGEWICRADSAQDLCKESQSARTPSSRGAREKASPLLFQDPAFRRFKEDLAAFAANRLKENAPEDCAIGVLTPVQKLVGMAFFFTAAAAAWRFPLATIFTLNAFAAVYFLAATAYRVLLMLIGAQNTFARGAAVSVPNDDDLPVITILAPLFKDADAIASLSRAIDDLVYPAGKKDVKFLLEESDHETLNEARRLGLDLRYEMIVVPDVGPRTKPKACNAGLYLARGALTVIYDAEDLPECDQLLKAAAAFKDADPRLACVQARLNYYNANDNWLTRMFALEYALWFDWLLPALQRLDAPIPLGGTSNFFRTKTLIKVGGWDPYNVTEDADLGLRLSRRGYRVQMLDSTTYEEANCRLDNWIRQRSRWIKGHLQTWLVHMRRPGALVKTTGWSGLISVQFFLAGNVFSALINPILWLFYLVLIISDASAAAQSVPAPLQWLNFAALALGSSCFIAFAMLAPLKRGWNDLSKFGFTAPLYWLLSSLAAYKALWQIVFRPYYWEKTDHVISKTAIRRRDAILRTGLA